MKRTLDDLRGALHEEADAAAYPDVDALVAGARRRVVATRRRRLAVLGAATAAVLVVGGLAITRPTHQALPQPAGPGPFTVNAGGAGFPAYLQGMKRLTVLDSPMLARVKGSISVPTTVGRRLVVLMTCTPDEYANDWSDRVVARFTGPGGPVSAPCSPMGSMAGAESIGIATTARTTVLADVTINLQESSPGAGPPFKDAKLHVATYESVPWQDYPFPPRLADLDTNPSSAWSNDPTSVRVQGPKTKQQANRPLTFTQPFDQNLGLSLEVRGPGRMRVLINGKDISDQVGPSLLTQDKFLSFWGYNAATFGIPFDPAFFASPGPGIAGPATKPGTPMTVTILPQDFQGPDWRVQVVRQPPTGG
ncbi:MAG: hypothetical protein ACYCV4_14195 [Dermatophilaceae bacterium]